MMQDSHLTSAEPPSMMVTERAPVRERASWALYDFANTIWSMNVGTLYFSVWLISDLHASNSLYAISLALSSAFVFLSVPFLGALSDARRRRKPWVVGFTIISCITCAAIGILGQITLPLAGSDVIGGTTLPAGWHSSAGTFGWVLVAFIISNYTYQAAQPFYNAMMPELAPVEEQGRLSGIGTAVGYVGTIVGLLMIFPFVKGELPLLGALPAGVIKFLRSAVPYTAHAGRVSTFVPTGILFLLFSLPLVVFCRDHFPKRDETPIGFGRVLRDVVQTLRDARRYPGVLSFILGSFLYQDAIGTIVSFMAVYAIKAMGFANGSETTLFLVLTVPAIFGSYFAGRFVDRIGAKRTLFVIISAWVPLLLAMILVPNQASFWGVGLLIGLVFGGVPTAERPLLLSLIPEAEAGRFFSLMLLSSRAAAVGGPLIWAFTVDTLEPTRGTGFAYRAAVLTVAAMFAVSLLLLRRVPDIPRSRASGLKEGNADVSS